MVYTDTIQIVLNAVHIVEYVSPRVLLEKPDGYFRSLVEESGDKDVLYAIAGNKS